MGAYRSARHTRQGEFGLSARLMFRMELPTVLTVTFLLLFIVSWEPIRDSIPQEETYRLLGLAAAAAAASAGIVAALSARMSMDHTLHVVATALAFYGLVVMPLSVTRTSPYAPAWLHGALFGASLSFLVLMALAMTPRHGSWAIGSRGVLSGFLVTVGVAMMSSLVPALSSLVTRSEWPSGVILLGWCALAVPFISRGVLAGDAVTWRIGLGLGVIAIAHLLRAAGNGAVPSPDIPFFALRLLGLLVLLGALGLYARQVVRQQRAKQSEEYTRLQSAALAAERAVEQSRERDHEIRNVVAGLSGAAYLLGSAQPRAGFDLGSAVTAELNRLSRLLERPANPAAQRSTPVPELLTRLVMLRRAAGADMELDVPNGLRVAMPPEPLAQVVTNLLVNCARYAPGAPVRVCAWSEGELGLIEVSDAGPGIAAFPAEHDATAQDKTAQDKTAQAPTEQGAGLGLAVSSRLLAEHGGSLRLLAQTPDRRGCTALIEIPLATAPTVVPAPARRGVLIPGAA